MASHAKLSPSSSHRWLLCPGSIAACEGIPDVENDYTLEGTAAHDIASIALTAGCSAYDVILTNDHLKHLQISGKTKASETKLLRLLDFVQQYIDYVNQYKNLIIEKRVDYSPWVRNGFGTADAISIDENLLTIIDLKFGEGVKVFAPNNSQLMLYALGAIHTLKNKLPEPQKLDIKMVIHQPRFNHVDEHTMPGSELMEWSKYVEHRAKLCLKSNAERVPGFTQCRFCPAKNECNVSFNSGQYESGPSDSIIIDSMKTLD